MTTSSSAPTLKQLATAAGIKVGFAASAAYVQYGSKGLIEFCQANFNAITAASGFDWASTEPEQNKYDFVAADFLRAWSKENGMVLRGHPLCWNGGQNPSWLATTVTAKNGQEILTAHIAELCKRYAGSMDSWVVVNEPISYNGQSGTGLSNGVWLSALGEQYIDIAFEVARANDPYATLILNLHQCENATAGEVGVRANSLALITRLVNRKVPIDAVGLESHIDINTTIDYAELKQFIESIRALGLKVLITEHDVNDAKVQGSTATRDGLVADWYTQYLQNVIPASLCEQVTFWSVWDTNNWMDALCKAGDAEYTRVDGTCDLRPGLLSSTLQIKPAYSAVANVLSSIK